MLDQLTEEEYRKDTIALISSLPSVSRKMGWIEQYITDSSAAFSVRVAAYIVQMSIFNSSLDSILYHLGKERKDALMPGKDFMYLLIPIRSCSCHCKSTTRQGSMVKVLPNPS